MARNTPLGQVRSMVKAETAKALSSTSTAQDAELNQIIYDMQQWLSSEYDWPFLKSRWDVTVPAGSRYLAFPTNDNNPDNGVVSINFERAGQLQVYVKWNQVWQQVEYGIREMEELNYLDSDRNQVLDPIQRWQFDDEGKFEVWPLPASGQTIRFVGQRVLTELRATPITAIPTWNDAALLDLDDLMVVYYTAAEYLLRQENPEVGKLLLNAAQNRLSQVRRTYPAITKDCVIGRGTVMDRRAIRVVPMVVVAGGGN